MSHYVAIEEEGIITTKTKNADVFQISNQLQTNLHEILQVRLNETPLVKFSLVRDQVVDPGCFIITL
jgi:hypothetical protein